MLSKTILDYLSKTITREIKAGNPPSFEKIARIIKHYMKIDDILIIVIQGDSGTGKTTFALRLLATVYGRYLKIRGKRYFVHNWKQAFSRIVWNPQTFFMYVGRVLMSNQKEYGLILDDAGTWLFKGPRSKVVKSFLKMYNLTRGVFASLIFTDIWSLDKYILDTAKLRIITEKLTKSEIRSHGLDPGLEWARAKVYFKKLTIKGRYEKLWGDIIFPLRTNEEYYEEYKLARRRRKARLWVESVRAFAEDGQLDIYELCSSLMRPTDGDEVAEMMYNEVCVKSFLKG